MANPQKAEPVKLFVGVLFSEAELLLKAQQLLKAKLGEIDYQSRVFPFSLTDFYQPEMGKELNRIFYSFLRLIDPSEIVEIKHQTNLMEEEFKSGAKRKINLDPGYLDYFKVVLASFKSGGAKIYLNRGVYADITLWFEKGKLKPLVWGFPDFKTGLYDEVLLKIRELYKKQIKRRQPECKNGNT